jgi:2,3-bisphosphoglycerate-dependent phosphoglycerate mutase
MPTLALVRHGQSIWNAEDRFTGWVDVPLSAKGAEEARSAGRLISGIKFQVAYTSALSRAQRTLDLMLEEMQQFPPIIRDAALNERMYGDLQGLSKQATRERYGDEQVLIWRRSYDTPPPNGESLKDTAARTIPFFERCILGDIAQGKNVLVAAHGNSNRSIVMLLDQLSKEEVIGLNLETGTPYVYELEKNGVVISKRVLA